MQASYPLALGFTLSKEGGWSDHPDDNGGKTMKGVTWARYEEFLGRPLVDENELRRIPEAHLQAIYREGYWEPVAGDLLPKGLDAAVFDFAVHSGVRRASQYLQRLVGVHDDGIIGPRTLDAVEAEEARVGVKPMIVRLNQRRLEFLKGRADWGVFKNGWTRRIVDLNTFAEGLAAS